MKKSISIILLALACIMLLAPVVFAEEMAEAVEMSAGQMDFYGMATLAAGLAIGLGALGTGIGLGIGVSGANTGVARNPGASGKITTTLIIGFAMVESLCIYALVIALLILFVNPFGV